MQLETFVWKEEDMYVIKEVVTGVTTQGKTLQEALDNIKEAVELYLEDNDDAKANISPTAPIITSFEVTYV